MADAILGFEFKVHFKCHSGKRTPCGHVLTLTNCPEMNATTCSQNTRLAKTNFKSCFMIFNKLCV